MVDANSKQVGGEHYRSNFQHWDFVDALKLCYLRGQVTKYITRWRKKNGRQDLEKARHFLEKYIQRSIEERRDMEVLLKTYQQQNELTQNEKIIIQQVSFATLPDTARLSASLVLIDDLLESTV